MNQAKTLSMPSPHTDHIGSLLRPPSLIDSFKQFARNELRPDFFEAAQDDAIREVVAKQEAHGVPYVTDGEFRRLSWQVSFSEVSGWDLWGISWKGFLKSPGNIAPNEKPLTKGEDAVVSFRTAAPARLKLVKSVPLAELKFLKSATRAPAKITLMGPTVCGTSPTMAHTAASSGSSVSPRGAGSTEVRASILSMQVRRPD
jgi:5-methyltetrahydropteroyltriglutamate--homocysteine methyltransferase